MGDLARDRRVMMTDQRRYSNYCPWYCFRYQSTLCVKELF